MATVREYGIDVSYHQGNIDWAAVKAAGVNYVILRAGYGFNTIDTQFTKNITGAIAAGIENIGVYWFNYAYNTDSITTEVNSCLETIAPYKDSINLPVWFDFESSSYSYVQRTHGISLTSSDIQGLARTWCNAVTTAGYLAGIYANKSDANTWFRLTNGAYLWEQIGCQFWYARYGANDETNLFIIPAFEATALSEHPETNILQYSDVGQISGINSNRVDLNVFYVEEEEPTPPTPPTPSTDDETEKAISDHIEYVEVRNANLELIGIIDTASSIIWHSKYYGVGDFEIYIRVSNKIVELLQPNNYITRPDNSEVGIIEQINISNSLQDGIMLTATGRFAKSILDRRHIYNLSGTSNTAAILSGNVETNVRQLVSDNAISCAFDSDRNISLLELGTVAGIDKTIVDVDGNATQKQVSYQNLFEYTEEVLKEYGMGAKVVMSTMGKLQYKVFEGADRSTENTKHNEPVVFSKEFDNLTDSTYQYSNAAEKNTALIGGEGEGIERYYVLLSTGAKGLARRETWVDAKSINKTYKDDNNVEQTYTDAEYTEMLKSQGKQDLSEKVITEAFNGSVDITNGNYIYNRDFTLGDIVTVQDNDIGKYINVRILEVTEVQDGNGYKIDVTYDN